MTRNSPRTGNGEDAATRYRFYGDQFVLDTLSGNFYRVTPTAGFILRRLVAGKRPGELVNVMADHFKIDHARALRDVEMFTSELRSLGIIEGVGM